MIEVGDKVRVSYRGLLEDGVEFDASWRTGEPLEFVVGAHQVIPGLEKAVVGMSAGESAKVSVPAAEAYGEWRADLVERIPVAEFPNAEALPAGGYIEMRAPSGAFRVKVEKIEDGMIFFDHNHELAGRDLTFEVEVLEQVRESAVEREMHPAGCACGCDQLKASIDRRGSAA